MVKKFIIYISVITVAALTYVYQHTEIFKLAYLEQKKTSHYQELLDKNTHLRYNNKHVISLPNLGSRILAETEFEIPLSTQLAKLDLPDESALNRRAKEKDSIFSLFNIRLRQAEAKTIRR